MSQKIYRDDCAFARELVRLLEAAGHQVTTPQQAGIMGRDDEVHFRYAAENGLILLTKNPDDFLELHDKDAQHAGILLVYQDNDPDRDMDHAQIVRALANLEKGRSYLCQVLPCPECLALLTGAASWKPGSTAAGGKSQENLAARCVRFDRRAACNYSVTG